MAAVSNHSQPLLEHDVPDQPFPLFADWFAQAQALGLRMPEAAALATATAAAAPSARMVLVKRWDDRGFVFYTNYRSRKGEELAANPLAALVFYWDPLGRQVRIEGPVERTSSEDTAAYVRTRPRGSQISALVSAQSRPVASRSELERLGAELAAEHEGRELPLPADWGGFRLAPDAIEFWQQRDDRLHDRLRYLRAVDGGWTIERLAP
jgi:pyridoxamine 5'-phosphate oxidase